MEKEKEVLEKYEKALDDVLPQAFAIVKDTARRFSENPELVVTATDFDRELAAQGKDFVRIEDDKAIWQNHWIAGGNDMVWIVGLTEYHSNLLNVHVICKPPTESGCQMLPVSSDRSPAILIFPEITISCISSGASWATIIIRSTRPSGIG